MKKTPNRVIIINVLCTALLNGISMIMMPIYSRLLGTDTYGLVSIYTTWATVFSTVIGLQLASSLAVAQKDFPKAEQLPYQANGVYIGAAMSVVVLLIVALFRDTISRLLGLPVWSVLLLVPHGFGLFCVNFLSGKFTYEFKQEKDLLVSVSMTVGTAGVSVALILLMPDEYRYLGKVIGAAIPQIACSLLVLWAMIHRVGLFFRKEYVQYALAYALSPVFSSLCLQIFSSSDKLMLQKIDSNAVVGVYSLAFNFAAVVSSIWYALNHAWCPFYYRYEASGDDKVLLEHANNFIRLFSILTAGFLLLSPEVFKIFAAPDFWGGSDLIPLFVIGIYADFVSCFARNHQYYYKKTKTIATISIIAAGGNVVLNAFLIPIFGAFGAALATMLTQIISMIAQWWTAYFYASSARSYPYRIGQFLPYFVLIGICVTMFYQKQIWYIRWLLGGTLGIWMLGTLWKTKQIF